MALGTHKVPGASLISPVPYRRQGIVGVSVWVIGANVVL